MVNLRDEYDKFQTVQQSPGEGGRDSFQEWPPQEAFEAGLSKENRF